MEQSWRLLPLLFLGWLGLTGEGTFAQMSTDPRLCGGYFRETRGFINFRFNENTAPPDVPQAMKFCMWTITPTVPTEQYRYNITIRNVNLECGKDRIAINFFDEPSNVSSLGQKQGAVDDNPLTCFDEHQIWRREHQNGTTMVVILYVEQVVYEKGFYLEWEEGFDSRITPGRIRNTHYSWGKPSVAPNPYFAKGFFSNEISTLGFVKPNYTDGYQMEMYFEEISNCEGQDDWKHCFNNSIILYSVKDDCTLNEEGKWEQNATMTTPVASKNGFFIMVKIQDAFGAGGKFVMQYDTVRG